MLEVLGGGVLRLVVGAIIWVVAIILVGSVLEWGRKNRPESDALKKADDVAARALIVLACILIIWAIYIPIWFWGATALRIHEVKAFGDEHGGLATYCAEAYGGDPGECGYSPEEKTVWSFVRVAGWLGQVGVTMHEDGDYSTERWLEW